MFCSRCGVETSDETNFCPSCGLDLAATTPIAAVRDKGARTDYDVVKDALKGEYEISKELGRGGMAIVYHAREVSLDREVALKVLPFSLSHDEEFVERFQREARTAAKLEHPNIIPVYRVGQSGDVIYFAMKFLRGQSLSDVLQERGSMSPSEIRTLLIECASGLGYANKHGIVHRDIKPDNIMYNDRGQSVVTDFGIAKAATGTKLTGTGMAIGTPYYMSPEQARAQPVDGRSDLYSLGVVAYQCLVGSVPFDGEDSFSIGYKHIMEDVPTPTLATDDQRALFDIIRKMMAKEPVDRFQSAEELVAALEGKAFDKVSSASPSLTEAATTVAPATPTAAPSVPTPPGAATPPPTPTTPMPRSSMEGKAKEPKKKSRTGMVVGVAAFLVVGSLGGGFYASEFAGVQLPMGLSSMFANIGSLFGLGGDSPAGGPAGPATPVAATPPTTPPAIDSTTPGTVPPVAVDSTTNPADSQEVAPQPLPEPEPELPSVGTLVLAGLPGDAQVEIDGNAVRGLEHEVPPGRRRLTVQASGYEFYDVTIAVNAGQRVPHRVRMEALPPPEPEPVNQCEVLDPATYNIDDSCYDSSPSPLVVQLVPLTEEIEGRPSPATLAIQVMADGSVGQVLVVNPSDDPSFTRLAIRYADEVMRYNPAQKGGQPVMAWKRDLFFPGQRQ